MLMTFHAKLLNVYEQTIIKTKTHVRNLVVTGTGLEFSKRIPGGDSTMPKGTSGSTLGTC